MDVVFVADDLGAWLAGLLADAGRRKLAQIVLGSEQERSLRQAATAAVRDTAHEIIPAGEQAEHLAMVIGEAFRAPMSDVRLAERVTLLEELQAGITRQLSVLDDAGLTGTGQSSLDVLGVPGAVLAEKLTGHLVREIIRRGSDGGPLMPLVDQLNHDLTHLQSLNVGGADTNLGLAIQSRNLIVHGSVVGGRDTASTQSYYQLVPNQLPPDLQSFIGREQVLANLESRLRAPGRAVAPVVILTGMAGSGKSALAIHLAHKVADKYPDGQIYVRLDRYGDTALHTSEIFDAVLESLGLQVNAIQESLHARAVMYRSLLARRRVVIILDGATDTRQVRPLLSLDASSAVIITSRRMMPAIEDATNVRVDTFSPEESVEFLEHIVGSRIAADRHAALELADVCAHLPLALRLVGTVLCNEDLTMPDLVNRLTAERQRIDDFTPDGNSVKAVFEWSYRHLNEAQAKAFRLLSLFPGTAFAVGAAAAALAINSEAAGQVLDSLVGAGLLSKESGRYRYHDLLRAYGRVTSEQDSPEARSATLARVRRWYLDRVPEAAAALSPASDTPTPERSVRMDAVSWLETERTNMLALVNDAAQADDYDFVWQIADTLYPFYQLRGHWADSQTVHEIALNAARATRNYLMAGRILNNLGVAYREQRHYDEAVSCFEESLAASDSVDSSPTRDLTLMNLGVAHRELGQLSQAISCFEAALVGANEGGSTRITGLALSNLGNVYRDMGRYQDALDVYQQGLSASKSAGDRYGEGIAIANLGLLLHGQGRSDEAAMYYMESLALVREIGDRVGEGRVLRNLGTASAARGALTEAITEFEDSVRIARDVSDTETIYLATRDLGDLELKRGQRQLALKWYRECHDAARALGDPAKEAQIIVRLATDSEAVDEPEVALAYWLKAEEAFREGADQPGLASALTKAGAVLAALRRPEEAVASYEEAAAICRDLGDSPGELVALTGLMIVYGNLGHAADMAAANRRVSEIRRTLRADQR